MNHPTSNTQPADNDEAVAKAETRFGVTDLWIVLMTIIWGSNFTVIKYAIDDFSPLGFTAVRFTIASAAMLLITLVSGRDLRVSRSDFSKLFALALLQNVLYQVSFMKGMAHTRAGNAALILATTPLFTAVIGRLRKQEHFTYRGIIGLLLAFAGIGLIVLVGHRGNAPESSVLGDGLLILATVCWAIYTNLAHRFVHVYGSLKTTTIMMISGTPVLLLVCAPSLVEQDWSRMRPLSWVGVVYSGLLSIALAYIIWNHGVRKIGGTRTAAYGNLTPVVALLVAWPVLGEVPTAGQLAGAAVILCGIYLVRGGMIHNRPEQAAEEEIEEAALGPGKN
jgi:drug/metabolite transporter (DMT)-like permease